MRFLADARVETGRCVQLRAFDDYLWKNGNVPIVLLRWEYLGLDDDLQTMDQAHSRARPRLLAVPSALIESGHLPLVQCVLHHGLHPRDDFLVILLGLRLLRSFGSPLPWRVLENCRGKRSCRPAVRRRLARLAMSFPVKSSQ